jgi:hypothetical protein
MPRSKSPRASVAFAWLKSDFSGATSPAPQRPR